MTFTESISTVLSKYATFSGRATRPEYWWWVLFMVILSAITRLLDGFLIGPLLGFGVGDSDAGQPLSLLVMLALLLPGLGVAVRRLHDIGRSGWWILIGLIPIVGFLVLIYWNIQPSEEGTNDYG